MNSYSEFVLYSQNYYNNFGKSQNHDKNHNQHNIFANEQCQNHTCHQPKEEQRHVHEFLGSTKLAEEEEERHNHRFAGVSGQAIPINRGNHIHEIETKTDFFNHFHFINTKTGPAINVGDGKHVHFVKGITSTDDGHSPNFVFATLIECPLLPTEC